MDLQIDWTGRLKLSTSYILSQSDIASSGATVEVKERLREQLQGERLVHFTNAEGVETFLQTALSPGQLARYGPVLHRFARTDWIYVELPFSYLPLGLDLMLRWLVYALLENGVIGPWVFLTLQAALFVGSLVVTGRHSSQVEKHASDHLPEPYRDRTPLFFSESSTGKAVFLWGVWLSVAYLSYRFFTGLWAPGFWVTTGEVLLAVIALAIYSFAMMFLVDGSQGRVPTKAPAEDPTRSTPEAPPATDSVARRSELSEVGLTETEAGRSIVALGQVTEAEIDRNDLEITELEVQTASMARRVDAYTLESTLFGALAFSGFLTLVTSSPSSISEIQALVADLEALLSATLPLPEALPRFRTLESLRALVAVETLFCSLVFILVIVSRLRFMDHLQRVEHLIRRSRVYNTKEEETFHLILERQALGGAQGDPGGTGDEPTALEQRLVELHRRVAGQIGDSKQLSEEFAAILEWMKRCRWAGINSFLLILITSALWVSGLLAFVFAALTALAYTYTGTDDYRRKRRIQRLVAEFKTGRRTRP